MKRSVIAMFIFFVGGLKSPNPVECVCAAVFQVMC